MVPSLSFDLILQLLAWAAHLGGSVHTAIGFESVRMASEDIFRVRDILVVRRQQSARPDLDSSHDDHGDCHGPPRSDRA